MNNDITTTPCSKYRRAKFYADLQESEQAILAAASRIYAAMISQGQVSEDNQEEQMDAAVRQSLVLARRIEDSVIDAQESPGT